MHFTLVSNELFPVFEKLLSELHDRCGLHRGVEDFLIFCLLSDSIDLLHLHTLELLLFIHCNLRGRCNNEQGIGGFAGEEASGNHGLDWYEQNESE